MLATPQRIKGITHPLVKNIFVKSSYYPDKKKVIVIETMPQPAGRDNLEDKNLTDILSFLSELKEQVQKKIGAVNGVEIRACS